MGSFGGHALPGSFFFVFAFWWTTQVFARYFRSLGKGSKPFESTATFPFTCCCIKRARTWQWEGILKIFFTTVGFTGEIVTGFKNGEFAHLGNGQHATMFFFFALSGLTDILIHHKVQLPKDMDYVMGGLAFVVEGILFKFHLHGRTNLDVLLHTFLLYTIYGNVISLLVEMRFRKNPLSPLARCFFTFLQGTWFWQVGFILYNPSPNAVPWDGDNHDQMMVATMMFTWHMAAIVILMLSIGAVVGFIVKKQYGSYSTIHHVPLQEVVSEDYDDSGSDG